LFILPELFVALVLLAVAPNAVIITIISLSWSLLSLYEPVEYDKTKQLNE
jgi:hypothetical protein